MTDARGPASAGRLRVGVTLPSEERDGGMPSWPEIRAFAQEAERLGLDSLWMYDHFFYQPDDGPIEGVHEAWTMMSAVAAVTERVEIGAMVMCVSYRDPGMLAKMAVTLDEVSAGRLVLGIGAGWHDPEYDAFGFPRDHRVERFEEATEIIRGLLDGERVSFDGRFHHTDGAVLAPSPARRIPILIACERPRMLRITARKADAWNTAWYGDPDDARLRSQLVAFEDALRGSGREPSEIERTVGVTVRDAGVETYDDDYPGITGSVEDVAQAFRGYRELGVDHLVVSLEPLDTEMLGLVAEARSLVAGD
jgi:FMNH2-dependent dimethyl sulfone monooxygenase